MRILLVIILDRFTGSLITVNYMYISYIYHLNIKLICFLAKLSSSFNIKGQIKDKLMFSLIRYKLLICVLSNHVQDVPQRLTQRRF